jgi:hypothetical protein
LKMLSREELERCATEASTPQSPAIVGTLSGACLPSGACKSAAASVAGLIATLKDLLEKDQTYAEARTDQAVLDIGHASLAVAGTRSWRSEWLCDLLISSQA